MRKKWIFIGAAFALAMTLTGCRDNAAASIPQQSSQEQTKEQTQMIPMEEAQEAALKAADIVAADADISATTLSEVAGVACYKVEFTSGEYAYAYTINAETGAVMEMSSQEQNAQASGTQTETADPAAPAPAQNATGTGTVDEAAAQKIALEHAGVKAADATITKSKLDYEDGRQVYDIEWYAGGAKYDYEIATDTGEIISSAYEEKTMGADSKNVTVSEADAKKTALDRVSGATDKDLYEWKLDYEDGHRIKGGQTSAVNWIHSILKKQRVLAEDWQLSQCLFGEHLLKTHPDKVVVLVESEKSAVIGSAIFPDYVWLATGGKSQMREEKLRVLSGRTVLLFPDADAYAEWKQRAESMYFCKVVVSDIIERNATPKQKEAHIDIADWIIFQIREGKVMSTANHLVEAERILQRMIEKNPVLQKLIDDLDLVLVGASPIGNDDEKPP